MTKKQFERTRDIKVSPIKQIEMAAARIPGAISLAQGIPSFDTPLPIREYAKRMIDEGKCARYSLTIGLPELLETVAENLARDGMFYDPWTEIIATCGSIEAITASLMALTNPGDDVLIPSPTYVSYQEAIKVAGARPCFFPLDEDRNFDLKVDELEKYLTPRTKVIFYCNPNNPTGTIYSREQLLKLAAFAEKHDLMILTDEVYKDFIYNGEPYFSLAQMPKLKSRVVRVFSFSKAYAMTGWRIGFVHSDKTVIAEILKIHDSMVTCAPVVSQYAAIAAFEHAQDYVQEFKEEFLRRRDRTLELLNGLAHVFDYQQPNSSYFVFPRVKDFVPYANDSTKLAYDILEKVGVALVPGAAFGPTGESHLRISYGYSMENIEKAFERLNEYFKVSGVANENTFSIKMGGQPVHRLGVNGITLSHPKKIAVTFLRICAKIYLWRTKPEIIAITGSTEKTSTKRRLVMELEKAKNVRANPKSNNTEIGVILSVLDLDWKVEKCKLFIFGKALWRALFLSKVDVLILELGISEPGDARAHLQLLTPNKLILTNITPSFSSDQEYLQVMETEIGHLLKNLPHCEVELLGEDERLRNLVKNIKS